MVGMSSRGPYAKGVAKRAEILETALEIIARNGYSGATVKELADAVGLSQNGLLHYFGSKDALFIEILRARDEADSQLDFPVTDDGSSDHVDAIAQLLDHHAKLPGFVQLRARLLNEAAEAGHPSHEFFRERYTLIRTAGADVFRDLQAQGRVRADLDPNTLGVMLFALIDGLQTQWMYAPNDIDMAAEVRQFFAALAPPVV